MAPSFCSRLLFLCSVILIHQLPLPARAGDPDILTDFIPPHGADPSQINGTFFTYTGLLSGLAAAADPGKFFVSKAGAAEFPALLGQSVSYAALAYGAGAVNPPHIHPRASELLLVTQGTLLVGLVDAARNGTVYARALQAGDMFVFPKGMVHWQYNGGGDGGEEARAFSAFGGASPGTISLPFTLFGTGIDDEVLERSFRTDRDTVEELKRDLQQPSTSAAAVSLRGAAAPLSRAAVTLLCFGATFFFVW